MDWDGKYRIRIPRSYNLVYSQVLYKLGVLVISEVI